MSSGLWSCLFVSLLICRKRCCDYVWGDWTILLCCQGVQICCSTFCTLCGPVPHRILQIRSPYKRTCFTLCRANRAVLPLPSRAVFWIKCWCCRSPHTHTHTARRATNALGDGLNCACASLSENLIDNGKCQKNRSNSILLIWRSFDPRIKIVIKIRLIAQPYTVAFYILFYFKQLCCLLTGKLTHLL